MICWTVINTNNMLNMLAWATTCLHHLVVPNHTCLLLNSKRHHLWPNSLPNIHNIDYWRRTRPHLLDRRSYRRGCDPANESFHKTHHNIPMSTTGTIRHEQYITISNIWIHFNCHILYKLRKITMMTNISKLTGRRHLLLVSANLLSSWLRSAT